MVLFCLLGREDREGNVRPDDEFHHRGDMHQLYLGVIWKVLECDESNRQLLSVKEQPVWGFALDVTWLGLTAIKFLLRNTQARSILCIIIIDNSKRY